MIGKLFTRIHEAERSWSASYGKDISTPQARRQAWWHFHLSDHGFLRTVWTNLFEIAPGVWRSNQPSPARIKRYHQMGIRTILNLRGEEEFSYFLFEREAAAKLGMEMISVKLRARTLVKAQRFEELFEVFDRIERPFVMHCKSGADRAGLASALWMLYKENRPVEEAQRQLSLRFVHLKSTRTGVLDQLLATYAADNAKQPIGIREWFRTRYRPRKIMADFEAGRPPT